MTPLVCTLIAHLVAHDCGYPLSRYTCRATRVAADFLDFIPFCRCSTGVAPHPLNILVSRLPPCPGRCRTEIWVWKGVALHGRVAATIAGVALHCATKIAHLVAKSWFFFGGTVKIAAATAENCGILVHSAGFLQGKKGKSEKVGETRKEKASEFPGKALQAPLQVKLRKKGLDVPEMAPGCPRGARGPKLRGRERTFFMCSFLLWMKTAEVLVLVVGILLSLQRRIGHLSSVSWEDSDKLVLVYFKDSCLCIRKSDPWEWSECCFESAAPERGAAKIKDVHLVNPE